MRDHATAANLWARVRSDLGADWTAIADDVRADVPLVAQTAASALAHASVAAASSAAAEWVAPAAGVRLDGGRIAIAYASERHLRIDGTPPQIWSPLSGFFRSSDGWVRTHANYPHHADALLHALGVPPHADKDATCAAILRLSSREVVHATTAAGGLCVVVRREQPSLDALLRAHPVVAVERWAGAPARRRQVAEAEAPLRGIRVLDLTRVIAGPVATRVLSHLGADVLRLDPPGLPELPWQHLDTGHGKRSAVMDVRRQVDRFERLLSAADVVVGAYRPSSTAMASLSLRHLGATHPGLVIAQLSAWGFGTAAASRRGFDSLVQAESGIAWIESPDGSTPGALPVQALDHSAGYLLAAAVMNALFRQSRDGGTWMVRTSLRRIAAELLGMPRGDRSVAPTVDTGGHLREYSTASGLVTTTRPAIAYSGAPSDYPAPRPWGCDAPEWPVETG
ncbi:CoA transferase [Microbacterium sp. P01]|uniref:CoA transferase n=1 Tax=Microbacterium sp. P01 TaxID=3366261 RepID=UPI00366FEB3B